MMTQGIERFRAIGDGLHDADAGFFQQALSTRRTAALSSATTAVCRRRVSLLLALPWPACCRASLTARSSASTCVWPNGLRRKPAARRQAARCSSEASPLAVMNSTSTLGKALSMSASRESPSRPGRW